MSDDDFLRNRSTIAIITGGTQGPGKLLPKQLAMGDLLTNFAKFVRRSG